MKRLLGETQAQRLERRTGFWLATFTALAGGALGGLADVVAGDPATRDFAVRLRVDLVLAVLALGAAVAGWRAWHARNRLLTERGTAYVVDSPMAGWTSDQKDAFLAGVTTEMARIAHVPGPTGLSSWRWPLGTGAERWSDAVDDLVLSFRSVWANDDRATPDSVVCWAGFPVAIAWTARAHAAERSLKLAIRQRPSTGRAGRIDVPDWQQGVHAFDPPVNAAARGQVCEVREARIDLLGQAVTGGPPRLRPRVLLIRLHAAEWAGVAIEGDDPVQLRVENRTGQPLEVGRDADLHEWRYLLEHGRLHPWHDYPALVAEICDWIAQTAHRTGPNLVGMLVPQEIGLGIGVNVSRRSHDQWPAHLWPLVKQFTGPASDQTLTVPGLDLGHASLHRRHQDTPR